MQPIFIALLAEVICFLLMTLILRVVRTEKKAKMITCCFLAVLPLLILFHILSPSYDGVSLIFSIFLYVAGFFGGLLQLYNLADRGFSLRILIDIDESPSKQMSLDEIMTGYSQGRGIEWMYTKRIEDMKLQNLVTIVNGIVSNTEKGGKVATLFSRLRRCFRFPALSLKSNT